MFRSIMVPLDGSRFSEQALPLAEVLGRASGSRVHLGHVFSPTEEMRGEALDELESEEKERYLSRLVDDLKGKGVQADPYVLEGKVVDAIEAWSGEMGADLIVMASHGRAGLERLRLGSVAESLVTRGFAPMLVLHPGEPAPARSLDQVVVALDGSSFARTILDPLKRLGAVAGVKRYTLVRVTENEGVGEAGWTPLSTLQARTEEQLEAFRAELEATGAEVEVRVVQASDAAEGILEVAHSVDAGLIAMTTHGMTGVRPTLLGSVAAKVLHNWEGPLLLRRPERAAA